MVINADAKFHAKLLCTLRYITSAEYGKYFVENCLRIKFVKDEKAFDVELSQGFGD